ncbi:hypothetical protein NST02_02370 [Robertmurraya sp. FSL W8-0741]|uniref:hypothetical protein n=1 Tax=Robertmurraya TaxID=2837507 RepID=UPI0010F8F094|nr:hypothetical protein [Robertmurraya siralis]
MRKHHLYAAKLSINQNLFSYPLNITKAHFKKGIATSEKFFSKYKSLWNFIDVTPLEIDEKLMIAGRVLRAKDEITSIVDTNVVQITKNSVENVAKWSNFLFDYQNEIVVFEERKGRISRNQFIEVFTQMIERNAFELGELKYELLPNASDLKKELKNLKKINYAKFHLIPANWDDDEEFNDLDEELKNLKSREAVHEYIAHESGLNPESKLFRKPVNMTLAGYGHFDVRGKDRNNENRQILSKQELLYESIQSGDDKIDEFTRNYLTFLKRAIDQHLGAAKNEY